MRMRGVTRDVLDKAVAVANDRYDGNLAVHPGTHTEQGPRSVTTQGRLIALDSRGPGTRTSWSGRHGPFVCWHAYRDVMRAIFEQAPDAVIITSMARYDGAEGFEDAYPDTAYKNVGSMAFPAFMPELCDCGW